MDSPIQPIACVIGHPIAGNPTQFAVERALPAVDFDWRFLSMDVTAEQLHDAISGVRALGILGVMVDDPHRQAVVELCDELAEEAAAAGQVDVISRTAEGALRGHHFGSLAIAAAIDNVLSEPDARGKPLVTLLGDDANMLAAVRPLMQSDRFRWRVSEMAAFMLEAPAEVQETDSVDQAIDEATVILIRGLRGAQPYEVPEALLDRIGAPALVIDLAETSSTSPLARYATQHGLQSITRLDLLVDQTAQAIVCWSGQTPDRTALREAFEEYLEI